MPAKSEAVPAASEIPNVPLPLILLIVTVRVRPVPETLTVPVAVPVVFRVMLEATNVLAVEVGVGIRHQITDRPRRRDCGRGRANRDCGDVLSTTNVALGPAAGARLPAKSEAVSAASEIPNVPSPVMPLMVTVRVSPVPETPTVPVAVPVVFSVMSEAASVTGVEVGVGIRHRVAD